MTCLSNAIISKLSDSGQTITPSAEDIRGRTVKDQDARTSGRCTTYSSTTKNTRSASCW